MYRYHNGLTEAHPASSPWWAWPLNLKPVWFYQEGLAAGTAAAIYDAGNLVIWWVSAPAMVWVSVMAFRRRSLALTLIAVGFAAQWIPWARIDRAAFQYHYYTALPFVVLALAYFVAELWHGASRATWRFARLVGAAAIVLPAAMWLFSRPLCAIVGVESVNPGSQACPAVIPEFVLTARTAGLAVVAGVGCFFLIRAVLALAESDRDPGAERGWYRSIVLTGAAVALGFVAVSLLHGHRDPDPDQHPGRADRPASPASRSRTSRSGSSAGAIRAATSSATSRRSSAGSWSCIRTSPRCPCPAPSSTRTRASCRPTCTRSSSR